MKPTVSRVPTVRAKGAPPLPDHASQVQSLAELMRSRLRLDFIAGLLTVVAAVTVLGVPLLHFALTGQDMSLPLAKLNRWVAAAFPLGAFLVFGLSFVRRTPWFPGIFAGVLVWILPVPAPWRLAAFLALCLVLGQLDVWTRWRRAV